jgi:hypothetical protein
MRLVESSAHRLFAAAVLLLAASAVPSHRAHGDEPQLAFDFGRTLECRDVTPADFAETYPDERVVEATLRLSVYLSGGDMTDVETIRVELSDCDRRLRVFDFSPSTRLESSLAADVQWTKTTETSHELGASLGGELPACIGDVVANVTPSINAVKGGRETITETQVRLAPKQAVIASGTIDGAHGVFFTLRPSPQISLEGVHELTVSFVVPAHWRGDAVRVTCQAAGQQKVLWMTQQKVWARSESGVALYLAGDAEARRAAERRMRQ